MYLSRAGDSKAGSLREGGRQLEQFALDPTLLGVPYSLLSLLSCKMFSPQIVTPACPFYISCILSLFNHWHTPLFICIIVYSSTSSQTIIIFRCAYRARSHETCLHYRLSLKLDKNGGKTERHKEEAEYGWSLL